MIAIDHGEGFAKLISLREPSTTKVWSERLRPESLGSFLEPMRFHEPDLLWLMSDKRIYGCFTIASAESGFFWG